MSYELIDRIHQLLLRARAMLEWCNDYNNLYNELKPNERFAYQKYCNSGIIKLLIFNHNLYFADAVLCLDTLLEKTQKDQNKKELSLFEYFDLVESNSINENLKDLIGIREDYVDSNIDKIRNKIIAHKDMNKSGSPINYFPDLIKNEIVQSTFNLCERLKLLIHQCADLPNNNYFKEWFRDSHELFLSIVRRECTNSFLGN